jgi:hypothetical protein
VANSEHLAKLKEGVQAWNEWREKNSAQLRAFRLSERIDLSMADFLGGDVGGANLHGANLSDAKFDNANLSGADLSRANLTAANRTIQELLGHKDVRTTMICTHVLNRGGRGVLSPFDM